MFGKAAKKRQAKKAYLETTKHVKEKDVGQAASGSEAKMEQLGSAPSALVALWEDIKTMTLLLKDYAAKNYRDTPWTTIASVTAAVLYFVSPIDLLPDFIPGAGYLDDAAVVTLCVASCRDDLEKYRRWRANRANPATRCGTCGELIPAGAAGCANSACQRA